MIDSVLKERVFSIDNFNMPEEYKGKKAVALLIARLLLLEPGTDTMRPEMGVGLVSKYRYMFPEKLGDLKQNISDQLSRYLPQYQNVPIVLTAQNSKLFIDIRVNNDVYKYVMDEQEDNQITLSEISEQENLI